MENVCGMIKNWFKQTWEKYKRQKEPEQWGPEQYAASYRKFNKEILNYFLCLNAEEFNSETITIEILHEKISCLNGKGEKWDAVKPSKPHPKFIHRSHIIRLAHNGYFNTNIGKEKLNKIYSREECKTIYLYGLSEKGEKYITGWWSWKKNGKWIITTVLSLLSLIISIFKNNDGYASLVLLAIFVLFIIFIKKCTWVLD
ncbi:hypothetical protein PsalMR5_04891 (plasmid) [Piscirickettsia salmonis]|uniref:hypothetical protein n=1 Tax=Piscirickettsia salmonis TaxID=1238 RepID=UPI0012BAFF65|nr:hypothetical protein [Piscirickettsia salmonis]QGP57371.1 hypothetical protein PsalSR1_04860 [Piscirickettsia salmonis]QGP66966.1 hypothetical protein PsalMR5_04891 [Piscirickettsia salmonis]